MSPNLSSAGVLPRRADQVILLETGRIGAVGTLDELLEQAPGIRELWEDDGDDA